MRIEIMGGLRTRILGGDDGRGGGDGPAVVLLHGFGAPGGDLVPLSGVLDGPAGTRWVFPEAPLELPWGWDSRAWWMIDLEKLERAIASGRPRDMADEVPEGLPAARDMMLGLLAELETRFACPPERVVLGGFSQGSMLALDLALRLDRAPRGVVLWSTTLLCASEWEALIPGRSGMRGFQSHGVQDPLLPFAAAQELNRKLTDAGWRVAWCPFRGQHEIPEPAVEGASELIGDVLGSATR